MLIGRPKPGGEFRNGPAGAPHFETGRIRLPEVFDADGETAGHVAGEDQSGRSMSRARVEPTALRIRALLDSEPVGAGIAQLKAEIGVEPPDVLLHLRPDGARFTGAAVG